MQKINIIGIIEEDARETKNGRAGFPVIVKTMKGTIEKKTKYYVFTNKDDSFPMLKKNVQVCVVGDLDISYRTNKETGELVMYNGRPITDLTVSADNVVLCGKLEQ